MKVFVISGFVFLFILNVWPCVLQGESPPHSYCQIGKNLNRGLVRSLLLLLVSNLYVEKETWFLVSFDVHCRIIFCGELITDLQKQNIKEPNEMFYEK